jgi:hypothetical protein
MNPQAALTTALLGAMNIKSVWKLKRGELKYGTFQVSIADVEYTELGIHGYF